MKNGLAQRVLQNALVEVTVDEWLSVELTLTPFSIEGRMGKARKGLENVIKKQKIQIYPGSVGFVVSSPVSISDFEIEPKEEEEAKENKDK